MSQGMKEVIKFSVFLVLGLAVVVLACVFILPMEGETGRAREARIVRYLVSGAEIKAPITIHADEMPLRVYWATPDVAVVFFGMGLFDRTTGLVVRLDGKRITAIHDVTPGLAPYHSRLGRTLRGIAFGLGGQDAGAEVPSNPGLDVMGGATVDYSRLSSGLNQLVKNVRKAGNN